VLAITRMTAALLAIPSPVVAAINGHALGGGFVLALCCDYRLVVDDPSIKLGIPEAQAGVPFPVGPTHIIQHELPAPLLRRLALASAIMSPRVLTEAGVFDQVVAADALEAEASAAALRLAAQPAFATVKRQVRGALADTVASLAAAGTDPYIDSFG
jgi:enoyl-CoA hydratase